MNPAYKHLDAKLKVHELTLGQWAGAALGVGVGLLWGLLLSPFGLYVTLASAIYVGGIPAGAVFLASVTEFDAWLILRSALRWRRGDGLFVPGPGPESRGYVVRPDPTTEAAENGRRPVEDIDLATFWEAP
jgi:hypothetical protein